MSDHHFRLSDAQCIQPLMPDKVYGVLRVDDRRVISGIVHLIRNGLRWRAALPEYGPTLYNRFVRWSKAGLHLHLRGSGRREPGDGDGDDRRHPQLTGPRQPVRKGDRCIERTRGGIDTARGLRRQAPDHAADRRTGQ